MKMRNKKAEGRKSVHNKRLVYIAAAIISILILTGAFLYLYPHSPSPPKAAIIDQLSSSQLSEMSRYENETFVEAAKNLLYKRFPEVDYYSDNATLEQYRLLPSLGYKLIIWRVHSALDPDHYVAISTSEKYVQGKYAQYSDEQLKLCNITGDPILYFAITPDFIKECMNGRFDDTVIILMSCNGLNETYYKTAETFIGKGVKMLISWDGWVGPSDNDNAIALLLQYLIDENNTIDKAVSKVPLSYSSFGISELDYYPKTSSVADYHIPNYRQNNAASNLAFAQTATSKKLKQRFQI
jgi:hypothetical protein